MSLFNHFCPHCGATLEEQKGFSSKNKAWVCKNCGQALYGKEDKKRKYKGIVWTCDECGEVLDNQKGFNDKSGEWKCTSCGYNNVIDESNILVEEEKEKKSSKKKIKRSGKKQSKKENCYNEDYICDNNSNYEDKSIDIEENNIYDNNEYDLNNYSENDNFYNITDDEMSTEEYEKIYEEKIKKKEMLEKIRIEEEKIRKEEEKIAIEKNRAWFRKNWKKVLCTITVIVLFISMLYIYILYNSLIQVGYNPDELIGLNYMVVEEKLLSRGFDNIEIRKITDLTIKERDRRDIVTDITINNKNDFKDKTKFLPNKKIIIVYHTTMKYSPPITSQDAKKKQYNDIIKKFENAGFKNIKTKKIKDLTTGWITKDGEVEKITINSNDSYTELDEYEEDAEVIIEYHTYKNKK